MGPMQQVRSTDGVVVAVHDLGGQGPPAVLVHATGFSGLMWQPVADLLSEWHCWAPDVRAHGEAVTPGGLDLSWWGVAEDVAATVADRGLQGCPAAGHSMGATALLLAELSRPGTFGPLYCYEPVTAPVRGGPTRDEELAERTLRRRETFPSRKAARDNFAAKMPFAAFSPASLDAYVQHCFGPDLEGHPPDNDNDNGSDNGDAGPVRLRCGAAEESTLYRMGARHGLFERLGEIRCPVTVASGLANDGHPSAFAAAVASQVPHASLVRYEDLSHFGPQEDPARIAAGIAAAWST